MSSTLYFFTIPALSPALEQAALSQFLATHRVASIEKQWIAAGTDSAWAICVTVALGQDALPDTLKMPSAKTIRTPQVDYRALLNPDDFALFAILRNLRKDIAAQEGVPVYALFSNEHLATMAIERPNNIEALRSIEGVGEVRIRKYGAAFIALLRSQASGPRAVPKQVSPNNAIF